MKAPSTSFCPVCGKPIPKSQSFCSESCEEIQRLKLASQKEEEKKRQEEELKEEALPDKKLNKVPFDEAMPISTAILQEEPVFLDQFAKGEGSQRRQNNIQAIKEALKKGDSLNEIIAVAGQYFKTSTIEEYLRVARELLKIENSKVKE